MSEETIYTAQTVSPVKSRSKFVTDIPKEHMAVSSPEVECCSKISALESLESLIKKVAAVRFKRNACGLLRKDQTTHPDAMTW